MNPSRLKGKQLSALRLLCYVRDEGLCMRCGKLLQFEPRFDGDPDAYDIAPHEEPQRGREALSAKGSSSMSDFVTRILKWLDRNRHTCIFDSEEGFRRFGSVVVLYCACGDVKCFYEK